MKEIVVLGASGIIGQHMRLCVPPGVKPRYFRRVSDHLHEGLDLEAMRQAELSTVFRGAHAVVNLAGESRVDEVEKDPDGTHFLNVMVPDMLATLADQQKFNYVHVSSQAVFGGLEAPYGPSDHKSPVNAYGDQKLRAEHMVMSHRNWAIVRPTFILGIRPLPHVGRVNPLEMMFRPGPQKQVVDRYFSPCFARDAAMCLWTIALMDTAPRRIYHAGCPVTSSRFSVAIAMRSLGEEAGLPISRNDVEPVSHDSFPGIAERPRDTSYKPEGCLTFVDFAREAQRSIQLLKGFLEMTLEDRARELALFLSIDEEAARAKLAQGFAPLHREVEQDFLNARANQNNLESLLAWYRTTTSYLWELSVYHLDPGWNHMGMCGGIALHLYNALVKDKTPVADFVDHRPRVLCLGDGIGDLSITVEQHEMAAVYHDLKDSRTAAFAEFRFIRRFGKTLETHLTTTFAPELRGHRYDAIIALDFFEHVPNVEEWVRACFAALNPNGLFLAQNAFAQGDADHGGSIPMHLSVNNHFVYDWDPLLDAVGFHRPPGGDWRVRPVDPA